MQLKVATNIRVYLLVLIVAATRAQYPGYCSDCEEEIWEEVPCEEIASNTTSTAAPPTTVSIPYTTPTPPTNTTASPTNTTAYGGTYAVDPKPYVAIPANYTTNSTAYTSSNSTYKKCYCECKVGCKDFCRKIVVDVNPKTQIKQESTLSQSVPSGYVEIKHSHERKFVPNYYSSIASSSSTSSSSNSYKPNIYTASGIDPYKGNNALNYKITNVYTPSGIDPYRGNNALNYKNTNLYSASGIDPYTGNNALNYKNTNLYSASEIEPYKGNNPFDYKSTNIYTAPEIAPYRGNTVLDYKNNNIYTAPSVDAYTQHNSLDYKNLYEYPVYPSAPDTNHYGNSPPYGDSNSIEELTKFLQADINHYSPIAVPTYVTAPKQSVSAANIAEPQLPFTSNYNIQSEPNYVQPAKSAAATATAATAAGGVVSSNYKALPSNPAVHSAPYLYNSALDISLSNYLKDYDFPKLVPENIYPGSHQSPCSITY